jgi:hypothetical protein
MGTEHDLNRQLYVLARPGEPVTPELLSAYTNLLYFAANVTGVRVEQLRLAHLVRWLQQGMTGPVPSRPSPFPRTLAVFSISGKTSFAEYAPMTAAQAPLPRTRAHKAVPRVDGIDIRELLPFTAVTGCVRIG